MAEEAIHIRVTLQPGDRWYEKFSKIQAEFNAPSYTEVVHSLITRYRLKRSE